MSSAAQVLARLEGGQLESVMLHLDSISLTFRDGRITFVQLPEVRLPGKPSIPRESAEWLLALWRLVGRTVQRATFEDDHIVVVLNGTIVSLDVRLGAPEAAILDMEDGLQMVFAEN